MEKLAATQSFFIAYIECGLYKKINNDRSKLSSIIKEDIKELEEGKTIPQIIKERKEKENLIEPKKIPRKMPCGAYEFDENHYPYLNCDYCDHKFTEASVPGFC